jgi:glycosyltransferase involved in cell wall biosynthesis
MRIGINARFLLKDNLEGIGVFTHEIIKRLVYLLPNDTFYFYFDRAYDSKYIYANNIVPTVVYPSARHPLLWKIWFDYSLPYYFKKDKIDIFISTDGYCSLKTEIPQIMCVHDIAFEYQKNWIPVSHYRYMHNYTPKFLSKAKELITVSEFCKQDIIQHYKIQKNKIHIIYNASHIEENEKIIDVTNKIEVPYFIYVGAVHPRKNVLNLIKAFEIFKQKYKTNFKLLLVGRNAWLNDELQHYIATSTYKQDILWYENVSTNDLAQLYKAAYALTYLSFFEGFGIPLVEAMQFGLPIITSNTSAMPEIAKDAALYANPNGVEEIADKMQEMVINKDLYFTLQNNSRKRFQNFSWDKNAQILCNIIEKNRK